MSEADASLLVAFELHNVEDIRAALDAGAAAVINGKPAIYWLLEMYTRSDRFPACVRLMLERGAAVTDAKLIPVLLNDAAAIAADPACIDHRTTLVSAFTPLVDVPLLHVAAEYGHLAAVEALLALGADVNAKAGDGHTAIFHTVHSHANRSLPVLEALLAAGAKCDEMVPSVVWGRGFDWETTCFDVTAISYCQMGLLPQFQRKESDIYGNIRRMLDRHRRSETIANVPNKYQYPNG